MTNTARSRTRRRLTLRGVGLRAVLACAEFCREQFCLCRPLLAFKGNVKQIQTKAHIFYYFKFRYLCKNEFLRKTILACLSGDQMGSINEKNRGQKSRDTAPLSQQNFGI